MRYTSKCSKSNRPATLSNCGKLLAPRLLKHPRDGLPAKIKFNLGTVKIPTARSWTIRSYLPLSKEQRLCPTTKCEWASQNDA